MNNFTFLKQIDKNLYEIIAQAEELYRDEYYEQSITQTRRFGEVVCKNILGNTRTSENTFDDMLATLKDKVSNTAEEKEFIDDLYFLKKEGNASVHSSTIKKDGIVALECLQRAFEVALNYSVYYKKSNTSLLKLQYDTEMLITGKKSKKRLKEIYLEEKNKNKKRTNISKNIKKQKKNEYYPSKNKFSLFWILFAISLLASLILIFMIFILSFVS